MASALTFTDEINSQVPAKKLFTALSLDAANLFPKVLPEAIKSIELVEGNGGPGSITKINFIEDGKLKYAKHRIDALDKEKMTHTHTVIEGDALGDKYEAMVFQMTLEPTADGGAKGTNITKIIPKPGVQIKEEELLQGKTKSTALFKAVEAYLIANPLAYN